MATAVPTTRPAVAATAETASELPEDLEAFAAPRWRRVSARARARDDLGRERHANQQYRYGLAEDDRDYLQVVQVQKRRDSEPGGENKVEVDV